MAGDNARLGRVAEADVDDVEIDPVAHRWTREQYDRAVDADVLEEDSGIELIDGELLETKVTPQKPPHAAALQTLHELLMHALPDEQVRNQLPLAVSDDDEPEPDLAVVPRGDYSRTHPTTARVVVEVSWRTVRFDRTRKAFIYGRGGIPTYWVVDVRKRCVEVYTDPCADGYRHRVVCTTGELLPGVTVEAIFG